MRLWKRPSPGIYKMKPRQTVYLCFSSDFLVEDADPWLQGVREMMRERQDRNFSS